MSEIINYFINLPFGIRVAVVLFLGIFGIWKFWGNRILWILSIIPFLIHKIFIGFYLLIQEILHTLHKKVGWIFGTADGEFVNVGKKISENNILNNIEKQDLEVFYNVVKKISENINSWYQKWKSNSKPTLKSCFFAYVIGCVIIIAPSYLKTDNKVIRVGERGYLFCEETILNQVEKSGWYESKEKISWGEGLLKASSTESVQKNGFETVLMVAGLNSSLLVRDIPYVENSIVLERLYNDDCVTWNGEIAYSRVENRVEPWKVTLVSTGLETLTAGRILRINST